MKKSITTGQVATITGGILYGSQDLPVSDLLTDSRYQGNSADQLFFAIKGVNHDGHDFIGQLQRRGVIAFVVERLPAGIKDTDGYAFILVNNTVEALQLLAAWRRNEFKGRVIAVTGSAGKTVVKEWLANLLSLTGSVTRSPKSYNSQIGVPLSVWRLDEQSVAGVFEAGISQPGEMESITRVIRPDTGVITNIGEAHSKNFSDLESKAAEKLILFRDCESIIYCRDHKVIHDLIRNDETLCRKKITDWSAEDRDACVFVNADHISPNETILNLSYSGRTMSFNIPFADRASVENAITVAAVCLSEGMEQDLVGSGLSRLESVAMRMEMKTGINGCIVIEDYYNSDPGSLGMAIDYVRSQNSRSTSLILSDFLQSGKEEKSLYSDVARMVRETGVARFTGIGEALVRNRDLFPDGSSFFRTTDEFIRNFHRQDYSDEIILLKGARIFEFERISLLLEQQVHQTVLEINLDAISHNLNQFRNILHPGTGVMAMVKAFAYGAGPAEIAGLMEYHRVNYLAVAYADEGVELRESGVSLPVMVMNPESSAFELMIRYNLEPEIYSFNVLRNFSAVAARHGLIAYPVHIKFDSGMHRLGFMPWETGELIAELKKSDCLRVMSVFTHLAATEDPSLDTFTHDQMKLYLAATTEIRESLGYDFLKHALNSAGIVRFPEYQLDMVRPGIGIYGIASVAGLDLRQAGRFKSRISQVKLIPGGEPVGYGCLDRSDEERRIAIVPVGYADGLNRRLGNGRGRLFINGRPAPVIGNVCMDMCMADVTGIEADEGDEAEIFGDNIPVQELAEKCGTIPYEVLTSIPSRVKRIFYRE